MKHIIYFSKRMGFSLVYSLTLNMAAMVIMVIDENLMWLKYSLYALLFVIYALVITALAYRDGREAVKARYVNDVERMNIIKTGEDRPLNLAKEYKPWKGFMSGLFCCVPLVLLMLILGLCYLVNPQDPNLLAGLIASFLYIVIFSFFRPNSVTIIGYELGLTYFYALVAIPVYALMFGIPYIIGAKKQLAVYAEIDKKTKLIHGE